MAIKVFIKRKCPKDKERELFRSIKEIRHRVPQQSGYISGEYLKSIDETNEIVTISSWFSFLRKGGITNVYLLNVWEIFI